MALFSGRENKADELPAAPPTPAERRAAAIARCQAENGVTLVCLGTSTRWVSGHSSAHPPEEQVVELFCEAAGGGLTTRYWERHPADPDRLHACFSQAPAKPPGERFTLRRPNDLGSGFEPVHGAAPAGGERREPMFEAPSW